MLAATTVVLSACTGGGDSEKTTSATSIAPSTSVTATTPVSATMTTSTPTSTTVKPTPTPSKTVPVDQIPPGHPTSWVPAGVPTIAKYKEPGDVVPKFSKVIFRHDISGATASFFYYVKAVNWADAIVNPVPYTIICKAPVCGKDVATYANLRRFDQHWQGGRIHLVGFPSTTARPNHLHAEYVVRDKISVPIAKLLDRTGKVIRTAKPFRATEAVYMTWDGRLWNVVDDQYEVSE